MKIPAIVLIVIFSIIPVFIIIGISFFETNLMTYTYVGTDNYRLMWRDFKVAISNSALYVLMIPVFGTIISTIIVLNLADKKKTAQNFLRAGMYVPVFSSGVIISSFWKWFFRHNGIANWIVGQEVAWFKDFGVPSVAFIIILSSIGGQIMLLSIAVNHISTDQYEAAVVDGASWWNIKLRIILPQLLPTISILLLFSIVGSLQIWETIFMVAPYRNTASMMYRVFADGFIYGKYGIAAAECVVMLAIILAIGIVRETIVKKE